MNWKKHPPTCTCGKCEKDRASRARQQEVAQAKMTGQPIPPAPVKRIPNDVPRYTKVAPGRYAPSGHSNPNDIWGSNQPYDYYTTSGMYLSAGNPNPINYYSYMMQALGRIPMTRDEYLQREPTPSPITIDSIPEETDLVRGWRTYTIDARGQLKGSRAVWQAAELTAICEYDSTDVVQHLLNGCPYSSHAGCGIYSHKVGPEYLKTERPGCSFPRFGTFLLATSESHAVNVVAQCISSGVVVEHEHGYRAEKCRIEQMWLVTPRRCANGHWVKMETGVPTPPQSLNEDWLYVPLDFTWVNRHTGQVVEGLSSYAPQSSPPRWTCSETPVENPGAAYAQVLSTKYGVPCIAMPTAEFIAKLDEGSL